MSEISKEHDGRLRELRDDLKRWQGYYHPVDDKEQHEMFAMAADAVAELLALRERAEPVAELYAELYRLREEVKGPDGFATWKEAAIAERAARVKCEVLLNQRSCDIDYLTAAAAFHSDDWHKMSSITAYMHGWNARKASAVDSSVERDARRYRFLRDKEEFGDDAEPGLVSWDELTDLDLCDFDAAVDARLAAAGFEPLYTAPPAPVVPDGLKRAVDFYEQVKQENTPSETGAWKDAVNWVLDEACRAAMLNMEKSNG